MVTNRNCELYSQIVAVTTGIGTFVGYLFWVGMLQLPKRRSIETRKRDFGAAGGNAGSRLSPRRTGALDGAFRRRFALVWRGNLSFCSS
jgi:hypothetical protein